jgi:hypothetical protein
MLGMILYVIHSQFRASRNRSATDLLRPVVNKPISGCVRSPCTCLSWQGRNGLSTGLLQAVVTELQQCCFQQASRKLLTQSCSNAVFNNLRQTCCEPRKAPYEASCMYPLFWTKNGQTGCRISVVVFRKITRLLYNFYITNLRDNFCQSKTAEKIRQRKVLSATEIWQPTCLFSLQNSTYTKLQ